MCALLDKDRRDKARASRAGRREECVAAARVLVASKPWSAITLDVVAAHSGLGKGGASLFFESREALFSELMREEVTLFFAELDGRADVSVARTLVRAITARPTLPRLLAMETEALAPGTDVRCSRAYYGFIVQKAGEHGRALDRRFELAPGTGARLLVRTLTLAGALAAAASRAHAAALDAPDAKLFAGDLALELEALLSGWIARD